MAREMKNSGIEWIGEIPKEWKILQVKNLCQISRGRVIPITDMDESYKYPVYSSQTKNNGVMGYINTYDYNGDALTWTTDGANAGTMFYRSGLFNCTNVCGILQQKPIEIKSDIKYLLYSIGFSAFHCRRLDINGFKIMSNEMAEIKFVLPPLSEQQKIANYLDKVCGEVDEMIALQEQMIEELKAYKQSVITEAVTKGLNPNTTMKDSGIDWIGEVPVHWEKDKIIRIFNLIGSGTTPSSSDNEAYEGNLNWIQSGDINGGDLFESKNKISEKTLAKYSALTMYDAPFIIIAMYGASVGNISISHINGCVNQACCVMSKTKQEFKYLFYAIKSTKDYLIYKAVGGGQPNISQSTLKQLWLPIPPLSEQQSIASYLDTKCAEIDALIAIKQAKIEELKDYKKSVIYEYVTGKKEVV